MTKRGIAIISSKKHPDEKNIYDVFRTTNERGQQIKLNYSPIDGCWSYPYMRSSKIINTGSGIIFESFSGNGNKMKQRVFLDYSEVSELQALLTIEDGFNCKEKQTVHYLGEK